MAISKWKSLIGGSKIFVYTDNKNLLGKSNDFYKKANRWKACIQDLDIEYIHINGKDNIVADDLTRNINSLNKKERHIEIINSIKYTYPLSFTQFVHYFHIINDHPGILPTLFTLEQNIKINKNKRIIIKNLIKYCNLCQT
ncbi:Retrovirus-related Pol polyprotein from transposon opus [Dictyocoela muelleri]|nr:Retrovirus-related Pol polyprotein from transposon opus [Dictyocoela muelleri]